jgi:ribosomal protein S27AE
VWLLLVIVGAGFALWAYKQVRRPEKLCTACGTVAQPEMRSTMSDGIALLMWGGGLLLAFFVSWFFLVLPIGHLLVRLGASDQEVCPKCGSPQVVPLDTPVAQNLLKELKNSSPAQR